MHPPRWFFSYCAARRCWNGRKNTCCACPSDLREAAAIYRLDGWQRWRTLILPAIFPYLVTGLITATGGAWNASIASEYVTFNDSVSVNGVIVLLRKPVFLAQRTGASRKGLAAVP